MMDAMDHFHSNVSMGFIHSRQSYQCINCIILFNYTDLSSSQEMKFLGSRQTEDKIQPAYYTKECPEGLKMILPNDLKQSEEQENSQNRVQIVSD
jgi:hypothetical protein